MKQGGEREKSKKFRYLVAFKEVLIAKLRAGFQKEKFRKGRELGTTLENALCPAKQKCKQHMFIFK